MEIMNPFVGTPSKQPGFKASYTGSSEEKHFINNHLSFIVMFHKDLETDSARIVGFEVIPNSVKLEYVQPWDNEKPKPHLTSCDPNTKRTVSNSEAARMFSENKRECNRRVREIVEQSWTAD